MSHHEHHDEQPVTDGASVSDEDLALEQADAESLVAEGARGGVPSEAVEDAVGDA